MCLLCENLLPQLLETIDLTFMTQIGNVELKSATQQVIPALVTLGSDPNVDVKYATIDAFGAVAQHFKDEEVDSLIIITP